jgi:hypothetical protein
LLTVVVECAGTGAELLSWSSSAIEGGGVVLNPSAPPEMRRRSCFSRSRCSR